MTVVQNRLSGDVNCVSYKMVEQRIKMVSVECAGTWLVQWRAWNVNSVMAGEAITPPTVDCVPFYSADVGYQ